MNIYLSNENNFENNGLGFLNDCLSAKVTEVLNGDYFLEFSYPINGHLSDYLVEENIVKCNVGNDDYQLFKITRVTKDFSKIDVYARHISYNLLDNILLDVYPKNLNAQAFGDWILKNTDVLNPFSFYSDITQTKTARYVRKNPIEAIMGNENNSMVNLFGGELKRDNFGINLLSNRGVDNHVKLLFGKNIKSIKITIDISSLYTKIIPIGYDGLMLPETYVESPIINNYPTPKITKVEFSDIKYDTTDENAYQTLEEAYEALRLATQKLFEQGIDKPSINIKIDWLELSKTSEYKNLYSNLEKVNLGDIITANVLGMDYTTKVTKTIYNVLTDSIDKFEIGTLSSTIANTLNNQNSAIERINPTSILKDASDRATSLITSAMGGFVYKTNEELYIMDNEDPTKAQKVWRWNINGLGYSSTGVNGPYGLAMTMDGSINADFITSGIIQTNRVEGLDSLILSVDNLKKDVDTEKTITSYPIEITDAGNYNIKKGVIDGKSEQETRSGKNLYNVNDVYDRNTAFVSVHNDDWITITRDNSSGTSASYTNNYVKPSKLLKTDTKYYIVLEVKEVSGTGRLHITSFQETNAKGQFIEGNSFLFTDLKAGDVKKVTATTIGTFDICKTMLRNFCSFGAGQSGSITYRISVFENETDSNNFVYEKYGAMPSPDYSSEIKTIKGIENLFDKDNTNILNAYFNSTGNILEASVARTLYIPCEPNTTYTIQKTLSARFQVMYTTTTPIVGVAVNGWVANNNATKLTITTGENAKYLCVFYYHTTNDTLTEEEIRNSIMIEEGSISHSNVPYGRWLPVKTSGKNLFDKDSIETGKYITSDGTEVSIVMWHLSEYIRVIPNKEYTYQGITNAGNAPYSAFYDKDKKFISSFKQKIGINNITIPENAYYIRFSIYKGETLDDTQTFMFETGSIESKYESYKETISLIDMNKPNLFDNNIEAWEDRKYNTSTSKTNTGVKITNTTNGVFGDSYYAGYRLFDLTEYAGKTITLSCNVVCSSVNRGQINIGTCNELFESRTTLNTSGAITSGKYTKTFNVPTTITDDNKYLSLTLYSQVSDSGSVSGDYVEYNDLKIYEGIDDYYEFASINDVKDTYELVSGELNQKIGKVILNGSENGWGRVELADGYYRYTLNIGTKSDVNNVVVVSNYFKGIIYNNRNTDIQNTIYGNGNIGINTNVAATLTEFLTYLSENPVTLYYVLAEPQTIQLKPTNLELFEGYNYITIENEIDPNNMEITYLTDSFLNTQFATKAELSLTSDSITQSVTGQIGDLEESVEAKLELKVGRNENDQIISMINASAQEINLKANRFSMTSDYSEIQKDGSVKFTGGTIGGFDIFENKLSAPIYGEFDFTQQDLDKVISYLLGETTLTPEEITKYDVDKDGRIDSGDLVIIKQFLLTGITKDKPGRFEINTTNGAENIINLYDGDGKLRYYISYFNSRLRHLEAESLLLNHSPIGAIKVADDRMAIFSPNVYSLGFFTSDVGQYGAFSIIEPHNGISDWGFDIWASDKRLKNSIKDTKVNGLDIINQIKHRQFKYKNSDELTKIGYVADELEEIDKNMIFEVGEEKLKQPKESYIIPILSKAIQELSAKVEKLEKELEEMRNK